LCDLPRVRGGHAHNLAHPAALSPYRRIRIAVPYQATACFSGSEARFDASRGSRPSSWWRFGTVGRGALTQCRRWKVFCSRCGCGQRSTAWRIVQRAQRRYQALRLTAHRCAAAGLDSGTAPAVLASMPSTPQWIA
jgi:hypothetical protein